MYIIGSVSARINNSVSVCIKVRINICILHDQRASAHPHCPYVSGLVSITPSIIIILHLRLSSTALIYQIISQKVM